MPSRILACLGVLAIACTALAPAAIAQGGADIPRTPSGHPDLSGNYDTATVTPLQRPSRFGNRATLTAEEVAIIASDPDGLARTFNLAPAGSDERAAVRAMCLHWGLEAISLDREPHRFIQVSAVYCVCGCFGAIIIAFSITNSMLT